MKNRIKSFIVKNKFILKPILFTLIFLILVTFLSQGKITPFVYRLFD